VEYIVNPELIENYEQFKNDLRSRGEEINERLTFHGTRNEAIELIIKTGFKIGGEGVAVASGQAHGSGVYTSEDPAFAMRYIKDGRKRLLFARVCVSSDSKIVKQGKLIQQLIVKNVHQLLPCYIVHYANK